jgi:hypothetical protein
VLGKEFCTLPAYYNVLCTYILGCYVRLTKTRNRTCVPKKRLNFIISSFPYWKKLSPLFCIDHRGIYNPSILLKSFQNFCFMSICPVCLNYAQSCNPAIQFICWLKIPQTTSQWQTWLSHCSIVLGKAFLTLLDSYNVLRTNILCCYVHLTKTRNLACVPKNSLSTIISSFPYYWTLSPLIFTDWRGISNPSILFKSV